MYGRNSDSYPQKIVILLMETFLLLVALWLTIGSGAHFVPAHFG